MSEQTQVRRRTGSWMSIAGYPVTAIGALLAFGDQTGGSAALVSGVLLIVGGEIVSELRRP